MRHRGGPEHVVRLLVLRYGLPQIDFSSSRSRPIVVSSDVHHHRKPSEPASRDRPRRALPPGGGGGPRRDGRRVPRHRSELLERQVAVKVMLPDIPAAPRRRTHRQRFTREARLAARIRAPQRSHRPRLRYRRGAGHRTRAGLHRDGAAARREPRRVCFPAFRARTWHCRSTSWPRQRAVWQQGTAPGSFIATSNRATSSWSPATRSSASWCAWWTSASPSRTPASPSSARSPWDRTSTGSARYASPEQLQERGDLGPESDVFSLGLVGYELLTQFLPLPRAIVRASRRGCTCPYVPRGS